MKTLRYIFLPLIFLLTSCYIYRPYSGKEDLVPTRSDRPGASTKSLKGDDEITDPAKSQRQKKEDQSMKKSLTMEEEIELKQKEVEKRNEAEEEKRKESESKRSQKGDQSQDLNSFTAADGTTKNTQVVDKGKSKDEKKDLSELTLKEKLKPNKFYKITVFEKQYKIQVDKWDGDTLVAHKIRNSNKQFRFHQNDINEELLLERRFSKPFSDLFTVGAYVAGGVAVLLLIL